MSLPDYPVTREEMHLNAIVADGEIPVAPITRDEQYYHAIVNEDASDVPVPVTRKEQYLNAIATSDASNIPDYPITREEQFLAAIATGDTSDLPIPITREEQYLFEWAGGTYNTFTGSIARFLSPSSKPVKSIVCNIEPAQSGVSSVSIYLANEYDVSEAPIATITLPYTIYGGTVDVISGVGTDEDGNQFTVTPVQIDTLVGQNTLWSDADSVTVTVEGAIYNGNVVGIGLVGSMVLKV